MSIMEHLAHPQRRKSDMDQDSGDLPLPFPFPPIPKPTGGASSEQIGGVHYKQLAVEPWDAMECWLTRDEFIGFLRGNIIKYQARANSGKGTYHENMRKANHYARKLDEILDKHTLNKSSK